MDATIQKEVPADVQQERTMLNSIEAYVECGKRAAKAMNQHDGSRYEHENGWFRRAKGLETGDNKLKAQAAYDEGYNYARVVPAVDRFL
jgi:hypothetical protein